MGHWFWLNIGGKVHVICRPSIVKINYKDIQHSDKAHMSFLLQYNRQIDFRLKTSVNFVLALTRIQVVVCHIFPSLSSSISARVLGLVVYANHGTAFHPSMLV